jgi:hypothetical protein
MHDQPLWVNNLLFPPPIKNKRLEPPMTDRLVALIKHVAELRQAGLEACTASKNSTFGGFAPLVAGRNWRLNACEWPILTVNLRKVVPSSFLRIVDNRLV